MTFTGWRRFRLNGRLKRPRRSGARKSDYWTIEDGSGNGAVKDGREGEQPVAGDGRPFQAPFADEALRRASTSRRTGAESPFFREGPSQAALAMAAPARSQSSIASNRPTLHQLKMRFPAQEWTLYKTVADRGHDDRQRQRQDEPTNIVGEIFRRMLDPKHPKPIEYEVNSQKVINIEPIRYFAEVARRPVGQDRTQDLRVEGKPQKRSRDGGGNRVQNKQPSASRRNIRAEK